MRAFSLDLRERIVHARLAGAPTKAVAERFGVSVRTVERYVRQHAITGTLTPRHAPGRQRRLDAAHEEHLRVQLALHASWTLAEHCAGFATTTGMSLRPATMARAIARLGWTRKQVPSQPGSKTTEPAASG